LTYKGEIDVEKKLEKFNRVLRIIRGAGLAQAV
jgi:acetolactate synthase regulatory subunit